VNVKVAWTTEEVLGYQLLCSLGYRQLRKPNGLELTKVELRAGNILQKAAEATVVTLTVPQATALLKLAEDGLLATNSKHVDNSYHAHLKLEKALEEAEQRPQAMEMIRKEGPSIRREWQKR
jgi:hypothetical protein